MNNNTKIVISLCTIVVQSLISEAALAQETPQSGVNAGLEEIVVTAQKREQSLQKVPVTVTALSAGALEARGLTQLADLASAAPGLTVSQSSAGTLLPFLRGVGSTSNTVGSEGSIAVYVDGVYFARLNAGVFTLSNVDRVEVLKGPQGTLFGRNASGGVIQLITKKPSHDTSLRGTISYGNYDTVEASAYGTTGLSDNVAIDLAVSGRKQGDGFGRNITTGKRASFNDNYNVKSKVLFEPTDTTSITLSGLYGYSKVGGLGNTYPGTTQGYASPPAGRVPVYNFYDQRGDVDSYNTIKMSVGSLRVEQEFPFAKFTSISAYSHTKELYHGEGDFTERPVGPTGNTQPTLYAHVNQLSQEFQLASLGGGRFDWIAGLYYYNNLSVYDRGDFTGYGGGGAFDFDTHGRQRSKSYATFAQATYEVVPRLKLTGGIRYTKDKINASGDATFRQSPPAPVYLFPPSSAKTSASKVTWKGAVDYEVADNALLYASVSRSFKSGQFAILFFTPGSTPTRPEIITAYEAGFKTNLLDRRVRLNGAVFRYDIDSPQVQLIQQGAVIQSNAGAAKISGAEIEGEALMAEGLTLRFSGSYLDAKYTDYPNAPSSLPIFVPPFGTAPTITVDAKGNHPPLTAKFTYAVGFDYRFATDIGDFQVTADYTHHSGFYWEQDNVLRQRPMGLLDTRVRLGVTDKLGVSVWGRNLTGEKYASFATSLQGTGGYPYIAAAPRTVGATVDFKL